MAALLPSLSPLRKMATSTPIFFKVDDRPTPLSLFSVREMTTPYLTLKETSIKLVAALLPLSPH